MIHFDCVTKMKLKKKKKLTVELPLTFIFKLFEICETIHVIHAFATVIAFSTLHGIIANQIVIILYESIQKAERLF